jgi:RNA polymerase sigma factor (sigma-70 family)
MAARKNLRPIARKALAAQSDERLVTLVREGHAPAFEEVVGRYRAPLLAFAAAIVPYHRAEDVVQAALQKAHSALRADDREINLRPWLFAIVRNGALNAIRDDPTWEQIDPEHAGSGQPAAIAEQNEDLQRLVVAICALPDAQRQALVRREIEGDGHAEIAAALGTTATAVRGLIFRARTALRDGLGAMIPLPVMRMLMSEAPVVAGGGAAIGGLALSGGAKAGVAVTTAALALGAGGLIVDRKGADEPVAKASAPVERERGGDGERGSRGERTTAAAPAAGGGSGVGHEGPGSGREGGAEDGGDDERSQGSGGSGDDRGHGDDRGSGGQGGGSGSSGPGGDHDADDIDDFDDDDLEADHSGSGSGDSGDDDHSGPGGGDSGDDALEIEEEDPSGSGGGDEVDDLDDDLPVLDSDSSGKGGGDEPDDPDDD